MSATVCQNIVFSCFEPQLMAETAVTTMKLRVSEAEAPPLALDFQFTSWGCHRIFCDDPTNNKGSLDNHGFYPDPISEKSSISRLSAKSLEMCTENLGSETGTDTITDGGSIFSSSTSSLDQENPLSSDGSDQEKLKSKVKQPRYEEASSCRKFPPPLTTMSGTCSIQVRRHCEGGRLIIEAVERPLRNSYLQVERSGGRLRLCYLTDSDSDSESDLDTAEPSQEEEEEAGGGFESGAEEFGFQMLSRCKERTHENGGLCSNWKPAFWVATS